MKSFNNIEVKPGMRAMVLRNDQDNPISDEGDSVHDPVQVLGVLMHVVEVGSKGVLLQDNIVNEPEIMGWWPASSLVIETDPSERYALQVMHAIYALRDGQGDTLTLTCDNEEADTVQTQSRVEVCAHFTDWKTTFFYGPTWPEAVIAAEQARRTKAEENQL